ncbi:hypothetical protein DL89DRAFT_259544 [Linderina pennispora]|uniref:Uncharacterized protein n=1 Tax=Linderina pennispora TaxID=61395 RepID=A0A1Y1W2B5_9FUNG|nr:uncharacterized protein DL89DRAFT_259544 [Linderina pennispora]ORX67681.1 hypothetical protein DL89DRAFT_259544 [Linderina pennispora]
MKLLSNTLGLVPYLCAGYLFWSVHEYYQELTPKKLDTSGTQQPHRIGWRDPMKYDFVLYATDVPSFYADRANFFRDAQMVWQVKDLDVRDTRAHFSKTVRVAIPEQVRNDGFRTMYLHLIMQEAGAMEPHPAMNDRFAIYGSTDLIKPRALHGNLSHYVAHGNTRVVWEYVLDDNHFEMWKAPRDLSRLLEFTYYTPDERRVYRPILWSNPTYKGADLPERWTPLSDHLDVSGEAPLNATHLDVEVDLSAVSLAWIRFNQRLVQEEDPEPLLELARNLVVSVLDHSRPVYYAMAAMAAARILGEAFWRQSQILVWTSVPLTGVSYVSSVFCFAAALLGMAMPSSGIAAVDQALRVGRVGAMAMESLKVLRLLVSRPSIGRYDTSAWLLLPGGIAAVSATYLLRTHPGDSGMMLVAHMLLLGIGLVGSQLTQPDHRRPNYIAIAGFLAGDLVLTKAAVGGDPRVFWPALAALVPLAAPLLGLPVQPSARTKTE